MDQFLPYLISVALNPFIFCFFFCRYFRLSRKWAGFLVCALLYAGLFYLQLKLKLPGGLWLLGEAGLFAFLGSLLFPRSLAETFPFSVLAASSLSVCRGWGQCLVFWCAEKLSTHAALLKYLDVVEALLISFLFALLLFSVVRTVPPFFSGKAHGALLLLLIPMLFISLTERTVSDAVYGNTIVWDSRLGLIYPVVAHGEILFLQSFALLCLFALLFIWKRLTRVMLLEQQMKAQELYLKETCTRYEKTRSFRHDVKNHLTVLGELLHTGAYETAASYLSHLKETADALSYPIHTGRQAVDALLGSKLALAAEHHVKLQCELLLPSVAAISDLDWCILFSNALDNALHANLMLPLEKRRLSIQGSQKGNLYLLSFENACPDTGGTLPPGRYRTL